MDKYILGIETTCDETAASIVCNGKTILSNYITSQIDIHAKFGGVVPEVASRYHLESLPMIINDAVSNSGIDKSEISAVAIATEPGLAPSLSVGFAYASGLAVNLGVKLVHVNHLSAHVWANFLTVDHVIEIPERSLCLLVSGGHTQILLVEIKDGKYFSKILGETLDDAAGEAFDKVARLLKLPYPGGPELEKLAKSGNPKKFQLPLPMINTENYDFSFSGIKSHISRLITSQPEILESNALRADVAAAFQNNVCEVLATKLIKCAHEMQITNIYLAGGVACNGFLRNKILEKIENSGLILNFPHPILCTDNAAMIAGFAINLI